ncbi:MAG: hypothetical protein ACE5NW_03635 [Acidiferrobacterales bacterium]
METSSWLRVDADAEDQYATGPRDSDQLVERIRSGVAQRQYPDGSGGGEMIVRQVRARPRSSCAVSRTPFTPSEVLLSTTDLHNYNTIHFASGAPLARAGHLYVGDEPGLGVMPDEDVLGEPVATYQ